MATLALTLTLLLQVVSSSDLNCLGFISETPLPADVFVAASEEEGVASYASESELVYLNGPRLVSLKAGETYRVVRPEGTIPGPREGYYSTYYKGLGTLRIQRIENNVALAVVLTSCRPITKGDLVIPLTATVPVEFRGTLSNKWTPFPQGGLTSYVVLGKDYMRNMATGDFCFIAIGSRDGVKPGDVFTIYRLPPRFNAWEMSVSYGHYDEKLVEMLRDRTVPPRPVGDLIVVEAGETTAAARIINSLVEIMPGDLVIRR